MSVMCRSTENVANLLQRQRDMFRLAEANYDLTVSRLSALTGFHRTTISAWRAGNNLMDLPSFVEVARHVPDDLTSLMVEPAGKVLRTADDVACFDALATLALEYAATHTKARSANSPGGPAIVPCEAAELTNSRRKLAATAGMGAD